jgi:hypothetical protein
MELRQLVDSMLDGDMFTRIVNNPMAQFGPKNRRYLGATLLPEENKLNAYKETYIQYRSNVANAGTRYSPPQMKGNALTGSMFVELAESDIAAEFSSQDYDTIMDLIKALPDNTALGEVPPQAMTLMFRWAEQMLLTPLLEFNEMCRWQAIVSAQVQLRGDNGFAENVVYSNPAGHRVNAGGQWSNSSYDPYADIQAGVQKLQDKGYNVSRMIGGLPVVQMLLRNAKIQQRMGMISIASGGVTGMPMNVTLQKLNNLLAEDGLPVIEQYDLQYRTQTSTSYFLARNVFVMAATTGRDTEIDFGDTAPWMLPNTLGYTGIGRPANRPSSGRAVVIEYNDKKGAPVTGEAWQTSLPVITNPEAIFVVGNIS